MPPIETAARQELVDRPPAGSRGSARSGSGGGAVARGTRGALAVIAGRARSAATALPVPATRSGEVCCA